MPLSPDQFHEHLDRLEMEGVAFPAPGVASIGARSYPATDVSHESVNIDSSSGMNWNTEIRVADEQGANHGLRINRESNRGIKSMRFHPDPTIADGGAAGLTYDTDPHASGAWPHYQTVNSPEEFMERLPDTLNSLSAPDPEQSMRRGGPSPQPFHRVTHHHDPVEWSQEAHEYDPSSRSLTRDPENDYRPS